MFKAQNISRTMGDKILLEDCDLEILPGRFTAVVGPNGAGKTTLLKIMAGEIQASRGTVRLNKKPIQTYKNRELSTLRAILPQHTVINFPFTIEQVIEIGRYPYHSTRLENEKIIEEVKELTQLQSLSGRFYQTLSGGEKQRVQLARVIAQLWDDSSQPKYLLLDEPTSSLDLAQQQHLLNLAKRLCERAIGVMTILHDLNLALQFADDILFLKKGKTVAQGSCQEIINPEVIAETFSHPVQLLENQGHKFVIPMIAPRIISENLNQMTHEKK